MSREIDYTKMRLGTIVCRWTYRRPDGSEGVGKSKIEKCPKCGQKGEKTKVTTRKGPETGRIVARYVHKCHIVNVAGFDFCHIDEHCEVVEAEGAATVVAGKEGS